MYFKTIGVIGAGAIGRSLTETLVRKGLEVQLYDRNPHDLDAGVEAISQHFDRQMEKWAITASEKKLYMSRIHKAEEEDALQTCELVIETVREDLEEKKEVFRKLDALCSERTILASNTSTLSLTEIAGATARPERVIGLHFLHPSARIDLVEIVRGVLTSEETYRNALRFVTEVIEKKSVLVYESPGYVSTRLICVLINEAMHTLEERVASAEDIDLAMRSGYNFKYGPLEMCDRTGLDSVLASLERMFREFGDLKYRPSFLLKQMVRAGKLGVKNGEGFFRYDAKGNRLPEESVNGTGGKRI